MSSTQSLAGEPASDFARTPATEQTSLLDHNNNVRSAAAAADDGEESGTPPAREHSARELVLILGSIWVGVFLAALGMNPLY